MGPLQFFQSESPKLDPAVDGWLSPGCAFELEATGAHEPDYEGPSIEGDTPNARRNAVVKWEWL